MSQFRLIVGFACPKALCGKYWSLSVALMSSPFRVPMMIRHSGASWSRNKLSAQVLAGSMCRTRLPFTALTVGFGIRQSRLGAGTCIFRSKGFATGICCYVQNGCGSALKTALGPANSVWRPAFYAVTTFSALRTLARFHLPHASGLATGCFTHRTSRINPAVRIREGTISIY